MQQVCLIHVQNCFRIIDYPSEGPTPPKSYGVFTQSTDQQRYLNSSWTKYPLDICKEATSPFLLFKRYMIINEPNEKAFPPTTHNTSIYYFFFYRKEGKS